MLRINSLGLIRVFCPSLNRLNGIWIERAFFLRDIEFDDSVMSNYCSERLMFHGKSLNVLISASVKWEELFLLSLVCDALNFEASIKYDTENIKKDFFIPKMEDSFILPLKKNRFVILLHFICNFHCKKLYQGWAWV